ncbi:hypothetical protein tb265_13270 [Gemmatimonadetes bacterium T265]|nr:hypothetical protein tb265_13270 [Gemmatimonadetes bacterium T265]
MFADTLLSLERSHLLRLLIWGAGSVVAGTLLLALQALQRTAGSPSLLRHFAIQTVAWGAIDLALALWAQRGLALRDYAGARQLDRVLWLNLGLDAGYIGVGVTLALCGWLFGRRYAPVGAGLGVIVQGAALFLLDLLFVRQLQASL